MNLINSISNWYFNKRSLPYWSVLAIDTMCVYAAYVLSIYFVIGGNGVIQHFWLKMGLVSLICLFHVIFFRVFHTYSNIIRFSTFLDLRNVLYACVCACGLAMLVRIVCYEGLRSDFPTLRTIATACALGVISMCSWRIMIKTIYEAYSQNRNAKPTFIYGAREGAVSLVKSIRSQCNSQYYIKGLISPDEDRTNTYVAGVPVYKDDHRLLSVLIENKVKNILVSPLYIDEFRNNDCLINKLTDAGIRIYMPRSDYEWDRRQSLEPSMLHKVSIEDLLPREKIEVDMDEISRQLTGKRIMITGAAGSIGSEMVRQVAQFNPSEMVLVDQAETPMHDIRLYMVRKHPEVKAHTVVTSITNAGRMEQLFAEYKPEYVFHAAAYKHVPMMEDNPTQAVINNIWGTKVIADLSVKYGVRKFVMVSTDKAVNPTNVMGCSKRICEIYVQSLNKDVALKSQASCQFVTTRFGNVLGSNGSVIPLFREQLKNGGPLTVTHPDITRFFMLIPEACKLVLEAGTMGKGGEIFVFDMGKPVKIIDLARRMIALSGAKDVEIKITGLRDGEKLYEEVLNELEGTKPSFHEKIRIAEVREYEYAEVDCEIRELIDIANRYDDMATVRKMKQIVPEYKSNHSKYEALDR